jgi:hypothetical protein
VRRTSVGSRTAKKQRSALLDTPIPGGYSLENEHLLVEHAPLQESSAGTVVVEARRHLLDFGDMTPPESAELGSLQRRIVLTIKVSTGVARLYDLAVMERAPRFHGWLVPEQSECRLVSAAASPYGLVRRGRSHVAQDPSCLRLALKATPGVMPASRADLLQ